MRSGALAPPAEFLVGNSVGPFGRWFRLFIGIDSTLYLVVNPILLHPIPRAEIASYWASVALWLLALVAVYHGVFFLFGKLLFNRLTPWAGTAVFLGVPSLLFALGVLPRPVQTAFSLYVSVSLLATFFLRYGGCEVVAFPSLLFGARYTMYCPFNAIDAVERAVTPDERSRAHRVVSIVSLGITVLVGGYFVVERVNQAVGRWGLAVRIDDRYALLMLVPAAHLAYLTAQALRSGDGWLGWRVRKYGLGACVLVLLTAAFVVPGASAFRLWRTILAIGSAYAVLQALRLLKPPRTL